MLDLINRAGTLIERAKDFGDQHEHRGYIAVDVRIHSLIRRGAIPTIDDVIARMNLTDAAEHEVRSGMNLDDEVWSDLWLDHERNMLLDFLSDPGGQDSDIGQGLAEVTEPHFFGRSGGRVALYDARALKEAITELEGDCERVWREAAESARELTVGQAHARLEGTMNDLRESMRDLERTLDGLEAVIEEVQRRHRNLDFHDFMSEEIANWLGEHVTVQQLMFRPE